MYVNPIEKRTVAPSAEKVRSTSKDSAAFSETFELVLGADTIELTTVDPDKEREKKNPQRERKKHSAEDPTAEDRVESKIKVDVLA